MTEDLRAVADRTWDIYTRNAAVWDAERGRSLFERPWLDRLLVRTAPGDGVLDVGCGAGEPIARYLIDRGRGVTGVDFTAPMLAIARGRMPEARWLEADMRTLDLGESFAGVVAWDSFFHLTADEQRATLPRLARHVAPGGGLLVTVGPDAGEVLGTVAGEAVYHASLAIAEYTALLASEGMTVAAFVPDDAACDGHSVLLAVR